MTGQHGTQKHNLNLLIAFPVKSIVTTLIKALTFFMSVSDESYPKRGL